MTRLFNRSLRNLRVCEAAALIALTALGGCGAFTQPIPVVGQTLRADHAGQAAYAKYKTLDARTKQAIASDTIAKGSRLFKEKKAT